MGSTGKTIYTRDPSKTGGESLCFSLEEMQVRAQGCLFFSLVLLQNKRWRGKQKVTNSCMPQLNQRIENEVQLCLG